MKRRRAQGRWVLNLKRRHVMNRSRNLLLFSSTVAIVLMLVVLQAPAIAQVSTVDALMLGKARKESAPSKWLCRARQTCKSADRKAAWQPIPAILHSGAGSNVTSRFPTIPETLSSEALTVMASRAWQLFRIPTTELL